MASVRQRGQRRYMSLYRDSQGAQRSAGTYDSYDEALARARVAELDARPPEPEIIYPEQKRGRPTVAGYAPRWLDSKRLEPTSRESYGSLMTHIIRELGTVTLHDLDEAKCNRFFRDLEKRGLSSATVGHVRTVLRGLARSAVREGLMSEVPEMDIGRIRNREMVIATAAQVDQIEAGVPEWFRLWVRTAYVTGCRYGELSGLGPEHVILNGTHAVLKVGRRVIVEINGKPVVKNYGKTSHARRDIVIPLDLGKHLLANARGGFLFRSARGTYLSRTNARRVFKPAVAAVGLPEMRLHDMRHSAISAWIYSGKPLSAVMARAGHGDLKTLSRYTHDLSGPELWAA